MKQSIFFLCLFFTQFAYPQDFKKVDSLNSIVEKYPLDTLGINALCDLVYEYAPVDFDKAYSFANQALTIAQQLKDRKSEAYALNNIAIAYDFQSEFDKALSYYLEALKINEEINNQSGIAAGYMNIGVSFYFQNNLEKAEEWYLKSLAIRKKMDSPTETARVYNNLGAVYRRQGKYDKAIEMYDESLIIKQKENDKKGIATTLGNIGIVYQYQGNLKEALAYQYKSLEIEQEIQHPYGIASSLIAIGELLTLQKDYPKARQQYEKALQIAQKAGTKDLVKNAYYGLFQQDSLQGNTSLALQNYQNYVRIKDEIYNAEKSRQMIQMQTLYETGKKEHQIQLQIQENSLLKIINIAIFALAVLLLCVLVLIYNQYRINIKRQKMRLEKESAEKLYEQARNKLLQETIDFNNRELSSTILHLAQKNKVLLELRKQMEGLSLFQNTESPTRQRLKDMIKIIWSNLSSDNDWERFKVYFEGVHPNFFKKLSQQFPDLSPKEVKFCAYLKMNLDTKEIANLLNLSVRSIESHRLRIRKKLYLENNENLTTYLQLI